MVCQKGKNIWITWDDHRRSRELARVLGFDYVVRESNAPRLLRYLYLGVGTLVLLIKRNPRVVVSQNPSVVLAALLCLVKPVFKFYLVVDRHSNFKLNTRKSRRNKCKVFHLLSDYSLKKADLTIVTNKTASDYVEDIGATSFILPDKIPDLNITKKHDLSDHFSFFFVCTFSDDEPVEEVLEAFSKLKEKQNVRMYVSGNYSKFPKNKYYMNSAGINFLGFVDDQEYVNYLYSCDAVIVLTTMPMTLNCGSYEAVAAGKPQLVAASEEIVSYFYKGRIAVNMDKLKKENLVRDFKKMIDSYNVLKSEQIEFKKEIEVIWEKKFKDLKAFLAQ